MNGITLSGESTTSVGMDAVMDVVGNVVDFAFTCFNKVLENPILLWIFAAGLIPIGIGIFRQFKGAAKS